MASDLLRLTSSSLSVFAFLGKNKANAWGARREVAVGFGGFGGRGVRGGRGRRGEADAAAARLPAAQAA